MPSMFVTVSLGSGIESVVGKNDELNIINVLSSPEIYLPIIGFFVLLFSAFLVGSASIVLKSNSNEVGEIHALGLRGIGIGITLGAPSLRISSIRNLINYLTNIKKKTFYS